MKKRPIFLAIALALNLFYLAPVPAASKVQWSIVYTNDVMGEVEPCG